MDPAVPLDSLGSMSTYNFPLSFQSTAPDSHRGPGDAADDLAFLSNLATMDPTGFASNSLSTGDAVPVYPRFLDPTIDPGYVNDELFPEYNSLRPSTAPKRKRSSVACKACHDRRIRCDAASQGLPCSNCRRSRATECVFINSRRSRRGRGGRIGIRSDNDDGQLGELDRTETRQSARPEAICSGRQEDYVGTSNSRSTRTNLDGNESGGRAMSGQVDTAFNSGRVVYVGEPSPFSWLMKYKTACKGNHRMILDANVERSDSSITDQSVSERDLLRSVELQQCLFDSFLHNFLPLYPILNKNTLIRAWQSGNISPLLKHSILFIGALHVQAYVLTEAGYLCKQDALDAIYQKSRQIYDRDTEINRLYVVQSMFMLQFRFGSAPGHKDSFWWISGAVSLAQTMGMHRSSATSAISAEDQRLWKKIWWLLFIRDRQLASGTGKPMMIDDRDCDVEELTVEDFVDGESNETAQFTISMIKWAKIVTDIVRCKFSVTVPSGWSREDAKVQAHLALHNWQTSFTSPMQYHSDSNRTRFSLILLMCHHQMMMLLHRPSLGEAKRPADQREFSHQLAFYSAGKVSDLAGDMLKYFKMNEFPIYIEMIIFSAMALHSAESSPSPSEEKNPYHKRNETYISCLREFEKMYSAIRKYELYFGEIIEAWGEPV